MVCFVGFAVTGRLALKVDLMLVALLAAFLAALLVVRLFGWSLCLFGLLLAGPFGCPLGGPAGAPL